MKLILEMQIGKVSQRAEDDPFHASHATSVLHFDSENQMTITGVGINAAVCHANLQLLQKNRDSSATVLISLKRAGQYKRSRHG